MRTYSFLTVVFLSVALSFSGTALAQPQTQTNEPKVEVYEKIHIPKKKPIPYPYTRESNVIWEKTLWRMVDLREKMNLPLYYPIKPIGDRMSLINLIFQGVDAEKLTVYDPDKENEFQIPMTIEEIEKKMGNVATTETVKDSSGQDKETKIEGTRHYTEIKKYLLKEKWFFDKEYSTMQVRILGICPIRAYYQQAKGVTSTSLSMEKMFWVYYPEFRNLFASHPIYNRFNDAQQISFDDFLMQRRFNSYIYQESNVYNNRRIEDYTVGLETLMEGERIKHSIENWEHDVWEY
jgi:gliding motility associated protien GldN